MAKENNWITYSISGTLKIPVLKNSDLPLTVVEQAELLLDYLKLIYPPTKDPEILEFDTNESKVYILYHTQGEFLEGDEYKPSVDTLAYVVDEDITEKIIENRENIVKDKDQDICSQLFVHYPIAMEGGI